MNNRHEPSVNEKEREALEHLGEGYCLFCNKKISTNALYCSEECETKFNGYEQEKSECDKWAEVHDSACVIQEFLDFVGNEGIMLQRVLDPDQIGQPYVGSKDSDMKLIYRFFGVDPDKLESERRQLLTEIQSKQQTVKGVK